MRTIKAVGALTGAFYETYRSLSEAKADEQRLAEVTMQWGQKIVDRLNVELEVVGGQPSQSEPLLLVGNHISYVDIPLLISAIRGVAFVAKKQVRAWPFVGEGAALIGTVFVSRGSTNSRQLAKEALETAMKNGKRVVIFPSGTTSIDGQKQWRKGAFDIAESTGCLVQPFRLSYEPLREVAYIDDDFFPSHFMRLQEREKVLAYIQYAEPLQVTDAIKDCETWSQWCKTPFKDWDIHN
ncbi:MAG: 1-acyl-sn-glycerol-3-phosphate acyltransferase [Bdellovibrionales bacterium]|nr:1-acyl-sn-glycerol-3-phosphate acyltransferase [Bdellovibrionales bacterium]